jgi:hypothetical protein
MPHQHSQVTPKSVRAQICRMGIWRQRMIVGFPVGLITLAILGLTTMMSSLTIGMYVAGVVGYTGIVFAYAWIDEKMYFLSSQDTRSRKMIVLIHFLVAGALAAALYLIARSDPSIVPRTKNDISWPAIAVLAGVFLVMYTEIFWLAAAGRSNPSVPPNGCQRHSTFARAAQLCIHPRFHGNPISSSLLSRSTSGAPGSADGISRSPDPMRAAFRVRITISSPSRTSSRTVAPCSAAITLTFRNVSSGMSTVVRINPY